MSLDVIFIVTIALVILVALVLAELPIWIALAGSGTVGLFMLNGMDVTYTTLGSIPYSATAKYALVIIPMFVLMGVLASKAGLAGDLFTVAEKYVKHLPGGLGIATILASGAFGAVTGSSVATVATIGRIAVNQMVTRGYRPDAAAALVALGGTLGVLIPPSVIMVVYGTLTGESIGKMLLAGIIPGVITMACYSVGIVILYKRGYFEPKTEKDRRVVARFQEAMASVKGAETLSSGASKSDVTSAGMDSVQVQIKQQASNKLELANLTGTGYVILLFAIVIGGMYSGIFTATEAGAIAAAVALVILFIRRIKSGFGKTMGMIKESLIETASVTSMIFALLFGGAIFAFFLIKTNVPGTIAKTIIENDMHPMLIVIISLLLMFVLGMFLDSYSIMVIVIPLIYPIVTALGVNGIWFGILTVKAMEIGLLTPPVGVNVFVASGISKDVSAAGIFKAITPLYLTEVAVIIILILFPDVVTIIPDLAFAK